MTEPSACIGLDEQAIVRRIRNQESEEKRLELTQLGEPTRLPEDSQAIEAEAIRVLLCTV